MFHVKHRSKGKRIVPHKMNEHLFQKYRLLVKELGRFYAKRFNFFMEVRSVSRKSKRAVYDYFIRFTEKDGTPICAHVSTHFRTAFFNCRIDLAENVAELN
jgi:hypothetical protein